MADEKFEHPVMVLPEELGQDQAVHIILHYLRAGIDPFIYFLERTAGILTGSQKFDRLAVHIGDHLQVAVYGIVKVLLVFL
jgi:hypothetical protein